jgi:hypothetical protein
VQVVRSLVRVGAIGAASGRALLDRPLPLRDGRPLPPVPRAGVDPGPAVAWSDALAGAALALSGLLLLAVRRRLLRQRAFVLAGAAVALAMLVVGTTALLRSFRTL